MNQHTIIIDAPVLTWSERHTTSLCAARAAVIATTGITEDDYNEHVFYHGLRFIEHFASACLHVGHIVDELSINPAYGFWPWWRLKWLMDDAAIMKAGHTGLRHYLTLKGYMAGDALLEKELLHTIPCLPQP